MRRVRERARRRASAHPRTDDTVRYGQDPFALDSRGLAVGLATTQCGRTEAGIPAAVQAYCATYGETLLDGWGKRQDEWQLGLGMQHEILPRLSVEVTYNRRRYGNLVTYRHAGHRLRPVQRQRMTSADCQDAMLHYRNPSYDFYTVIAPTDPRLPNGGGYRILGLNTEGLNQPVGPPAAQTTQPGPRTTPGTASTPTSCGRDRGASASTAAPARPHEARHLLDDARRAERAEGAKDTSTKLAAAPGAVADDG